MLIPPPPLVWICLFLLFLLYSVSFVIFGFVFQASFLSLLLLSLKESFFELSWYSGGKTTITVERFMPLYRASPDRARRSLRVHVPSLSLFRCQLTFIFLHFPARVEALPGTQGFHYLRTTADMM